MKTYLKKGKGTKNSRKSWKIRLAAWSFVFTVALTAATGCGGRVPAEAGLLGTESVSGKAAPALAPYMRITVPTGLVAKLGTVKAEAKILLPKDTATGVVASRPHFYTAGELEGRYLWIEEAEEAAAGSREKNSYVEFQMPKAGTSQDIFSAKFGAGTTFRMEELESDRVEFGYHEGTIFVRHNEGGEASALIKISIDGTVNGARDDWDFELFQAVAAVEAGNVFVLQELGTLLQGEGDERQGFLVAEGQKLDFAGDGEKAVRKIEKADLESGFLGGVLEGEETKDGADLRAYALDPPENPALQERIRELQENGFLPKNVSQLQKDEPGEDEGRPGTDAEPEPDGEDQPVETREQLPDVSEPDEPQTPSVRSTRVGADQLTEAEQEALRRQAQEAEEKAKALEDARVILQEKKENYNEKQAALREAEARLDERQKEAEKAEAEYQKKQKELIAYQGASKERLRELKQAVREAEERKKDAQKELEKAEAAEKSAKQARDAAGEELAGAKGKVSEATGALERLLEELEERDLEGQVESARTDEENKGKDLEDTKQALADRTTELGDAEKALTDRTTELEDAEKALAAKQAELENAEKALAEKQKELDAARQNPYFYWWTVEQLEKDLKDLEGQKDQAVAARDQAETARDQAETARDQAETARDQTKEARDQAESALGQAEQALAQAQETLRQAEQAKQEGDEAVGTAQELLEGLEAEAKAAVDEYDKAEQGYTYSQEVLEKREEELQDAEAGVEQALEEQERYEGESRAEEEKLQGEVTQAQDAARSAEEELDEAREEYQAAQTELDRAETEVLAQEKIVQVLSGEPEPEEESAGPAGGDAAKDIREEAAVPPVKEETEKEEGSGGEEADSSEEQDGAAGADGQEEKSGTEAAESDGGREG
ncbi:MAG: hypothetical protein LBQ15_02525 [Clostridium sp.]|jgi:hypothetical protein|nr:hypothetical protein [Clostridium sp.]